MNKSKEYEQYEKAIKERGDMVDYYLKNTSEVYKVSCGLLSIEKPRIKTSFCFGYGMYGVSNEEEEKRAEGMVEFAKTKENYFLSENLDTFKQIEIVCQHNINRLKGVDDFNADTFWVTNVRIAFTKSWLDDGFVDIDTFLLGEKSDFIKECDLDDYERLLEIFKTEEAKFTKRLNTYLKKYGLSKIESWSFLVD